MLALLLLPVSENMDVATVPITLMHIVVRINNLPVSYSGDC